MSCRSETGGGRGISKPPQRSSREVREHCQGATAYEGERTRNPSQRQREQAFAHEVQEEREN